MGRDASYSGPLTTSPRILLTIRKFRIPRLGIIVFERIKYRNLEEGLFLEDGPIIYFSSL